MSAKEERLWIAFSKIDLNRDGMLTIEELSGVLGEDIAGAQAMIKTVDKNGDGQIDFDEFLDLWLKREEESNKGITNEVESLVKQQQDTQPDLPPGANFKHKSQQ